jgi:hypothetical protein
VPTRYTLDRVTELLPKLLYERLDEFGIDFTILYPTSGLGVPFHPDEHTGRTTCRAFNTFIADYLGEFSDRMAPRGGDPDEYARGGHRRVGPRSQAARAESSHDGESGAASKFG